MSGLLALLDDVAAIAKVAATSLDDVAAQSAKAGTKAAGAVIDDAAVTPKFVYGFEPARELPIVGRIALGSIKNKLVFLLPAALALSAFAPVAIAPLLMLGGCYLCFEGAEKIAHLFWPHTVHHEAEGPQDLMHLEEERVSGAIKTDFILSAEIMTITLAAIPEIGFWMEAATLALVAVGITVIVYGSVALIVKADDVGLHLSNESRFRTVRAFGRLLVRGMPAFLKVLAAVGTAAMLWVGGSILVHGLKELGFAQLEHLIHDWSAFVGHLAPRFNGFVQWLSKATLDGIFGLAVGFALIPFATKLFVPLWTKVTGKSSH